MLVGAQASAELSHSGTGTGIERLDVIAGAPIDIVEVVEPADLYRWNLDVGIDAQVRILSGVLARDQSDRIEQAAIDKQARLLPATEPSH